MPLKVREKMSQSAKNSENSGRFEKGNIPWCAGKKVPQISGKNHWNWKGGISSETLKRVTNPIWRELIKKIYKRDNWTCQVCAKHCRIDIQCHHIIPVREDGLDDPKNLVTLCRAHHLKIERSKFQDFWRYYLNKGIKMSLN